MPRTGPSAAMGILAVVVGLYSLDLGGFSQRLLSPFSTSNPTVHDHVRDIKYLGRLTAKVEHFQNIFYAQDTSGANRFAPPVKFTPSPGSTIDATNPGAWCPQATGDVLPFTSRVTNISENCLSLRVARPRATQADAKLPVVVWLHGGGHALGSGYEIMYKPDGLVTQASADRNPLIWVAINYRLGFFGFATGEALMKSKHTNAGLRDQRAALEWVQDNIEVFGGDPNRVTAIGQSVGASDISLQLTSYSGNQGVPFQRAITMSGGPGLNFNTMSDLVANNTNSVAEQVGCAKLGDLQSTATVECLRKAPVEDLTNTSVTAMRTARPPFGEGFFYPTYDDDFLPGRPTELMRAGQFVRNIPVIASWVTKDGAWYASPATQTDNDVLASFGLWLTGLSKTTQSKLLALYPLTDFQHMVRPEIDGSISPQYYRAAQINRNFWFACPVLDFAWQNAKHGDGDGDDNVRVYGHNATRFGGYYEKMGVPMWRVAHLSDIPFVLNNREIADVSREQLALSQKVSRTVTAFVTGEDPTGKGLDESWPGAFRGVAKRDLEAGFPEKLTLMLFGGPDGSRAVTVARKEGGILSGAERALAAEKLFERCEFINSEEVRAETGV